MKSICAVVLTVALPTLSTFAQQSQRTWPWSAEYTSSERGPHHTRWLKLSLTTNELGIASVRTNSFTQLGAGLNRWSGGAWIDATPELILTNGGVLGRGAQQIAFFASDFATSRAAVRVWMPNGQLLALKLLGLAYHDPATGTNILLAAPKSSSPQVVGTNSVWYLDCLDDLRCSVGYFYTADGVRQHVTLKESPAPPSAYGLPDASSRLLVISEIIEGPSPQVTERTWPAGREVERDQRLTFSDSMQMVPGRAFRAQEAGPGRGIAVGKTLETVGDRRFVVEGVRYSRVRNELLRLPPAGTLLTNASGGIITNASVPNRTRWYARGTAPPSGVKAARLSAAERALPELAAVASDPVGDDVRSLIFPGKRLNRDSSRRLLQRNREVRSQVLSSRVESAEPPGFVLDWELVNNAYYGFTFDTSTTWLIYNETHISPNATILPGAVLKYYYGASLHIDGPLDCPDPGPGGQKAILTSCNDDTAGEIFWSNGSPQEGEYGPALEVECDDVRTAQQRIESRYASPGIIASSTCLSAVSVEAADDTAIKGTSDTGTFTISRADGDWSQPLTVQFTLGGTAVSGADYQAIPNYVTIGAWAESESATITPGTPGSSAGSATAILSVLADANYTVGSPESATVTIIDPGAPLPPAVTAPPGLINWWRGENDFSDAAGGSTATTEGGLGFADGQVGRGFNSDGIDDRFKATPTIAFDFGAGADFSIEAWIKPIQAYTTYGVQTIVDKRVAPVGDNQALGYALWLIDGRLGCELADYPMAPYQLKNYGPVGPDLRDGLFHHVAMTVDRDSTTGLKLYVDGNLVGTPFDPTPEPGDLSNTGPLRIGNHANTYINCFFKGIIDEVGLYNRALSWTEVQEIFNAGRAGKTLGTLESPTFSPAGGSYTTARDVTMACLNLGVTIRYTLDGQEPTEASAVYSGAPIHVDHNLTLKARAWKSGWLPSGTESEGYRIEGTPSDQPPSITVSPPSGTWFLASEDIDLLVEASDSDGSISSLKLFLGGYQVAEAAASPLRYTLPKVAAGTYSFTAKAIDDQGFVTISSPVVFTVTAPGPSVALSGQQPFFTSSPGTLVASVTGVNPGTLASLTLNGASVPLATGAFTSTPALVEGENTFTLVATDTQNHTAQATTKVYLDSVHPTIAITAPANNSSFATTRINVSGTSTETSLKGITVNGVLAFVTGTTWQALNVPIAVGANAITAQADDLAGNTGTATISVTGATDGGGNQLDPLQLAAMPVGGFAPLQVTFTVSALNVPGTLQSVLYDFNGDGVTDQTETDLHQITHTYSSASEYFPVVTVVTAAGSFSSAGGWNAFGDRIRINVQAPPALITGATISVDNPVDVKWMAGNYLYVLSGSAGLTEYDVGATPPTVLRSISATSIGEAPKGCDVDADGNVYVAVTGASSVKKFKPDGTTFSPDPTFGAGGAIGGLGAGDGQFNQPYDVAVDPNAGEMSVSDSLNNRVQRFNLNGAFIEAFGTQGSGPGEFTTPKGLFYDSVGYLYVADSGNSRIVVSLSGAYAGSSGSSGPALGQFQGPSIGGCGNRGLYVAETDSSRVQFFDIFKGGHGVSPTPLTSRGALSTELGLNHPRAVSADGDQTDEKVWIADTGNDRVILARLPADGPEAVWSGMKQQLLAGNVPGAVSYFSASTAERYRQRFLSVSQADLTIMVTQIPGIVPVFIDTEAAQFRFEQTLGGRVLSFPIEFAKENGAWKVVEF